MTTSHKATRNAHDVMWKWIGWQRQRRTCYRVKYHKAAWCSIYECLFETIEHNKHLTLSSCAQQKYFSSQDSWNVRFHACFNKDMFRSKYARRVRPWSLSMLCRWRHWGRGMYLLPLQHHTRETSLSTWLPMPGLDDDNLENVTMQNWILILHIFIIFLLHCACVVIW